MRQVREISIDLRPPMLTDLGLLPTLLWHFDRYTARTGVTVEFAHAGVEARFAPEVELAAYRIVQEALTNIARHAHTDTAQISFTVQEDELCITIQDKGIGFDVQMAQSQYKSSGLTSMHERARTLGGSVNIKSQPDKGTQVKVRLPLIVM
jgi:signal transduction histidine kinase